MDRNPNSSPVLHRYPEHVSAAHEIGLQPLLTSGHLCQALPDQVRVSIFADHPKATGELCQRAVYFFNSHPGMGVYYDRPGYSMGPYYEWKENGVTFRLGVKKSFSLSISINPQRRVAAQSGLLGNTALPLMKDGADIFDLRNMMFEDIARTVLLAKRRYAVLCRDVLGMAVVGGVHANFSIVELDYDFEADSAVAQTYAFPFSKVVGIGENAKGISGSLRKGEKFGIYSKTPEGTTTSALRFEMTIAGSKIKQITGSQLVPELAADIGKVLEAVEARYLPVWLEVERHRQPAAAMRNGDFSLLLPRSRDGEKLNGLARHLANAGRVRVTASNRVLLATLVRKGLLEKALVRGYRVSAPNTDAHWQAWNKRPGEALGRHLL